MLINLKYLKQKYKMDVSGIIHDSYHDTYINDHNIMMDNIGQII